MESAVKIVTGPQRSWMKAKSLCIMKQSSAHGRETWDVIIGVVIRLRQPLPPKSTNQLSTLLPGFKQFFIPRLRLSRCAGHTPQTFTIKAK